ncbi:unnamed protein product [Larinioides sclopetarius]|uniref:Uncharacterized protein n=1 Tax=Larinioides sclopetarius TaxID=280406 RepID=A0AAV2B8C7_9ARAC
MMKMSNKKNSRRTGNKIRQLYGLTGSSSLIGDVDDDPNAPFRTIPEKPEDRNAASSIEAVVLVAYHRVTPQPLPKKVRIITDDGTQKDPPLLYPQTLSGSTDSSRIEESDIPSVLLSVFSGNL